MEGIVGPVKTASTGGSPLQAHVAHLRHLSKAATVWRVLHDRHHFVKTEAKQSADLLAAFVAQGLEFHEGSRVVRHSVRPVLQYYGYLNFAVATILAYRPPNYQSYKSHGVNDRTASLRKLELSSPVVKVSAGAVPLFHEILSDAPIRGKTFKLREFLVAIPQVSVELRDAFQIETNTLRVTTSTFSEGKADSARSRSQVQFDLILPPSRSVRTAPFPRSVVEKAMPMLVSAYRYKFGSSQQAIYRSKKSRKNRERRKGAKAHQANCLRLINFGGQGTDMAGLCYRWTYIPKVPMIPTMTAALLNSFFLASVFRYRPRLARSLEESRLNVLADVFVNEADAFMLPAFRNLLYREEMVFSAAEHI